MNKRNLTTLLFASLLTVLLVGADLANAQQGNRPGRGQGNGSGYGNGSMQGNMITKHIGTSVFGHKTFKIKQLLGLGQQHRGAELVLVKIQAQNLTRARVNCRPGQGVPSRPSRPGRGQAQSNQNCSNGYKRALAQLFVNGMREGAPQVITAGPGENTFRLMGYNNTIGMNLQSVQLKVTGDVLVRTISAKVTGGFQEQVQTVKEFVNIHSQGTKELKVKNILGMGQHFNGSKLRSVIMRASSARGQATAQLFINGRPVGMPKSIGMYTAPIAFAVKKLVYDNTLGSYGVKSIKIVLRGRVFVESLAAKIVMKNNQRW